MLLGKYSILILFHIVLCITKNSISSLDGDYHIKLAREYTCVLEGEVNKFWIKSQNRMTRLHFNYAHEYYLNENALNNEHTLINNMLDSKLVSANFDVFYTGYTNELQQIINYKDIECNNNKIVFKSAVKTILTYKNDDINRNLCVRSDTCDIEVKLDKVIFMPKNKIFEILKEKSLTFEIPLKQLSTYCEWENIKEDNKKEDNKRKDNKEDNNKEIKQSNEEPTLEKSETKHFKKIAVGVVVPLICVIILILLFYSYSKPKCIKIDSTIMYVTI